MKLKYISYLVNATGFFGYCFLMDYTINSKRELFFYKQKIFIQKLFNKADHLTTLPPNFSPSGGIYLYLLLSKLKH